MKKKKEREKERSWRKCKTAVTLSATVSFLLQKHATAKGSVSRAEPQTG